MMTTVCSTSVADQSRELDTELENLKLILEDLQSMDHTYEVSPPDTLTTSFPESGQVCDLYRKKLDPGTATCLEGDTVNLTGRDGTMNDVDDLGVSADFQDTITLPSPRMIGRFNSQAGEVVGTAVMNGKPPTGYRKSEIPVRRATPVGEDLPGHKTLSGPLDPLTRGRMEIVDQSKWTQSAPHVDKTANPHRRHYSHLPEPTPVKRCVGPVNEVSIVYRRPASPSSEAGKRPPIPLSPHVHIVDGGNKRPMSPASDPGFSRQAAAIGLGARCLSPPSGAETEMSVVGVCCEHCNNCLIELKRQALRLMFPDSGINTGRLSKDPNLAIKIAERLEVPQISPKFALRDRCDVCDTHIKQLKQEAVAMVHSIQQAQCESAPPTNIPALVGSCNFSQVQRNNPGPNFNHVRQSRQTKLPYSSNSSYVSASAPIAAQAQAYLEQNVRAWISPKRCAHVPVNRGATSGQVSSLEAMNTIVMDQYLNNSVCPSQRSNVPTPVPYYHQYPPGAAPPPSLTGSTSSNPSAAASFFARAAQKLSISSKRKKKHHPPEPELPSFPTNFCEILRQSSPPAPPCLMRGAGRLQTPGAGKVKVMLRICPSTYSEQSASFLSVDPRKKQVTVYDPSHCGYASASQRRTGVPAPKMFAFDAVFCPDDSVTEICSSSLTEIVQAVVNGADGCLFSYGHARFGKSQTIVGKDQSTSTLGVIPCAVSWLFKLINEQKEKTGARFSVRVSAVEVTGKQESLRDLLSDVAQGQETGVSTAPGVYLREDPICGTQLENQSELRAPTADKAAFYLDAALAARSIPDSEEEAKSAHLLFTLHVYQYRIEKSSKAGLPAVAGGRSRLHLIDLGSCSKSKDPGGVALSLSALGNVILALLNGQRHVPHRDSKIAQLLRDSLGNLSCRTCMIAHVTPSLSHYNESLQVIQLAARIHRMRRRKNKFSSTSSEESSCEENGRLRRYGVRGFRKMGTLREDVAMSHSDPDYTSSSEQSCDTVIYMGSNGQSLSDRELTDGEGPPRHVPRTNPRLPSKSPRRTSGSKSSGDEGSNSDSRSSYSSFSQGERGRFTRDDSLIKIGAVTRLPHRSSSATKTSIGAHSLAVPSHPTSPHISSDSQQRKVGIRTTVSKSKCSSDSEDSSSLQSFGMKPEMAPPMPRTNGNLWYREKGENCPLEGEKWIDGPGVEIFPEAQNSERWVDGPGAYRSTKSSKSGRSEHRKHNKNPTVSADEKWVDGPTEMVVRQNAIKAPSSSGQQEPAPRKHENKFGPSQSRRTASEKLAKCSVTTRQPGSPKHVVTEQERPTSMGSVDSNVSLKVQTGDSRPISQDSSSALKHADKTEDSGSGVKPFVRDWVERHAITADCNAPKSDTLHSKTRRDHSLESGKNGTIERQQKGKMSVQSPQQSPGGSPVSSRKSRSSRPHLQKADLSTLSSQSTRVADWVKSVSGSNGVPSQSQPKDTSPDSRGAQCITKASSVPPTTHNLENASSKVSRDIDTLNVHIDGKDVACDLSTQSSSDILENDSPTSRLLNRESMYEVQFDEEIEVFKHDDETFSSVSGTKEPEITDRHCELAAAMCALGDRSLQEQLPSLATCLEMSIDADLDNLDEENEDSQCPKLLSASNKARLRCPDGASNPNLSLSSCEEHEGSPSKDELSMELLKTNTLPSNRTVCANVEHEGSPEHELLLNDKDYASRSVDGQADSCIVIESSQLSSGKELQLLLNDTSKLVSSSDASKPPIPQKPGCKNKPSALPKLFSSSKGQCRSASSSPARGTRDEKAPLLSKLNGITPNNKSNGHVARSREKDKSNKSSSQRSGSQPAVSSPTGSTTNKSSRSNKSQSPSRSKLPIFSRKDSKESKSSSKSSHKSFGFSKKDKDKSSSSKAGNVRVGELTGHKAKGTDSDSGNDSGIVANERKKLLSPYATVTQPRTPSHSSSGHGSDNSSVISSDILSKPGIHLEKLQCGASSGYESMLRDSEATGTSSSTHEDTASESSGDRTKGSKSNKKRPSSTRRSRSAPARSPESPSPNKRDSPDSNGKGSKAWVDTRYIKKYKEEPFQIQAYGMTDIERMQKWRSEEGEPLTSIEERTEKIRELLGTQTELKQELTTAKDTLLVDRSTWSFDCKLLLCFSCRSRKNETKS